VSKILEALSFHHASCCSRLTQRRSPTAYGTPLCIYSPESANSLVEAFSIIKASNASFAVRGGGHSPLRGWANINDGVSIVTTGLKEISLEESSGNVVAGIGNSWGDVFAYTEAFGRLAVGARHSTVGLATIFGGMLITSLRLACVS
jgi:FAD/FMN-containing dehydrogenase